MGNKILASMREEASEFMKDPKKKMREWWRCFEFRHLWIARIFVYIGLFLLVIFVGAIIFANFNFHHTEATSARYMLSALVQSQAAIVAIVITLTLIAVQLTASAYSPRVIDIFRKNPDMWILLGLYGISIFYGLIILRLVKEAEGGVMIQGFSWFLGHMPIFFWPSNHISPSFEWLVSLALLLGICTFVALVPYMWNITDLLKPSNIMRRLSENINEDVLNCINKKPNTEDPIQPIADIICGVLEKHDFETAGEGLEIIGKQISSVKGMQDKVKISNYSSYFCNHLQRIGTLAAKGEHDEFTKETLEIFHCIVGDNSAENGLEEAMKKIASSLSAIGEASLRKSLRDATKQAAFSLGFIGKASANNGFNDAAEQVADSLGTIGKASVSKEVIKQIVGDLTEIGKSVAKKGKELEDALWEAVLSLESVGIAVANRKEHGEVAKDVIKSLKEIGEVVYIKLELKEATWQIAKSMGSIGFVAAEKGKEFENITKEAAKSLGELGKITADKGKKVENVTKEVVRSLEVISEIVNAKGKRELIEVTIDVIKSLKTVGKAAVKNTLEETGEEIADLLGEIGEASAEKGVDRTTSEVVIALKELGSDALKVKDFTDFALLTVHSLGVVGKSSADAGIKLKTVTDNAIMALNQVGKTAPSNIKDLSSEYIVEIAEIAIPLQTQRKEIEEDTKKFLEEMGIEISQRTS